MTCPDKRTGFCADCESGSCHECQGWGKLESGDGYTIGCIYCNETGWLSAQKALRADRDEAEEVSRRIISGRGW